MVSLERLEEGEIYIINLSHPRLGENVFYIGTFVGVISRSFELIAPANLSVV
jgi:hypothetical protein